MSSAQKSILTCDDIGPLNERQLDTYQERLANFAEYLRTSGKDPNRDIGYAEKSVKVRVSRLHRMVEWYWHDKDVVTELAPEHADRVVDALNTDEFRTHDGDRFSEGSKRKFVDVLRNWFAFNGKNWDTEISFRDGYAKDNADPFWKSELRALTEASLEYKSIPSYNNCTPEERDRWKRHLAQELGKPTNEVTPDDWKRINTSWKIPSLIRTTREAGWRPDLIARMKVWWYDPETRTIHIPEGDAVKNDAAWNQVLTLDAANMLENWLEQRANIERYDGREEIWLNRHGNPYSSGSLNTILRNLMEDAGINPRGRKLVWYSFRHSIGTYVYAEYLDLKIVADVLRQKNIASAARYVHTMRELKENAANLM